MPTLRRKLRDAPHAFWKRFGWPEICGTLAAVAGFSFSLYLDHSLKFAAGSATLAEALGFNGTIFVRAIHRANRSNRHRHGWRRPVSIGLGAVTAEIDCVVAEVLDDFVIRPFLIYQAVSWHRLGLFGGFLVGKILSDIAYYSIVKLVGLTPGYWRTCVRPPQTPYLELNVDTAREALQAFQQAFSGFVTHYAMKCAPDRKLLAAFHQHGCRFEVASYAELRQLVRLGVDPGEVLFSNPMRQWHDTYKAWKAGLRRFAADSSDELQRLAKLPGPEVYIRLGVDTDGAVGSGSGKFGVDRDAALDLCREAVTSGLKLIGLTFHVGSQTMEPKAWIQPMRNCGWIMAKLLEADIRLDMIDVGGGFPVEYGVAPPPLVEFADTIREAAAQLPYTVQLIAEPGRALVAEAGTLVGTVIGEAKRYGQWWLHVDFSAFHGVIEALESDCMQRFPVTVDGPGEGPKRLYNLTGPSCDGQDTMLYGVELLQMSAGQRVYLNNVGAYSLAYSGHSAFNGFKAPRRYYA